MGMNSAKIPTSFRLKNALWRRLNDVAKRAHVDKIALVENGLRRELKSQEKRLRAIGE